MHTTNKAWANAQRAESRFWGHCTHTYEEERKQLELYAPCMRLRVYSDYTLDVCGNTVLDVGGGPVSMLLKCRNLAAGKVVDPLQVPAWVRARYADSNIAVQQVPAESMDEHRWDEVWCYNVLQHVVDPAACIEAICRAGRIIRAFEWLGTRVDTLHPHTFTEASLNTLYGARGKTTVLPVAGGHRQAYGLVMRTS
jgi:2-polyprenyl-3-methyl-5-hydroxy-6-metoxy-1,4-benzoquinol methylase